MRDLIISIFIPQVITMIPRVTGNDEEATSFTITLSVLIKKHILVSKGM